MDVFDDVTRRAFLGGALGAIASREILAGGLRRDIRPEPMWNGVVDPRHFVPRAKRVIHLYMAGGPSHLETCDYKSQLAALLENPV